MRGIRTIALGLVAVLLSLTAGCSHAQQMRTQSYYDLFDTVTTITAETRDAAQFEHDCARIYALLQEYHQLYDIYHEYAGITNLFSVNRDAHLQPLTVDRRIVELLLFGREMYEQTDGYVNVAMGSVLQHWHAARQAAALPNATPTLPDMDTLQQAAQHCDMQQVQIDTQRSTVYLADAELLLDVGAIAKGYAVEAVCAQMRQWGLTGYSLNVGGNIRTLSSKAGGGDWIAGIQNPLEDAEEAILYRVAISNQALVTSGSYQRYFTVAGERYHHIIHPHTLQPMNTYLSVTVRADSSAVADALSTALFNAGYPQGLTILQKLGNAHAMWVSATGECFCSDGFLRAVLP